MATRDPSAIQTREKIPTWIIAAVSKCREHDLATDAGQEAACVDVWKLHERASSRRKPRMNRLLAIAMRIHYGELMAKTREAHKVDGLLGKLLQELADG